jgi:putative heme-binding domain-containing protein
LLANPSRGARAALPLIVRWDKNNSLQTEVQNLSQITLAQLNDEKQSDERRLQAATSLLALRQTNPKIIPAIGKILKSNSSSDLKRQIIELLGTIPETGNELIDAYPILPPELRETALNQILKRSDATLALLDVIENGKINLGAFSPGAIHRLRTHGDVNVARRANEVIAKLRGPETKEKDALIAKFTPLVVQPGNVESGHKLFTANCAVCHKFQGEGKEVAPDLTGMGVHGAAELLVHVLDPNRVVEANFIAYSIETKDDESFDGIIATENKNSVVLRNASGDFEIPRSKIKSQRSTGRSLMPEGFEALGGEALRDVLAYLCAGENKYRVLDLRNAFTANSSRGIYNSPEATEETLAFTKFGIIKVGEIPFEIISPDKSPNGNNLISLKGGYNFAKTMPQKVEIPGVNLRASKLHFLGGVGGWAFPSTEQKGLPVAKLTVHFADGQTEEFVMKNAEEIADYIGHQNVPGSKEVPGIVRHGQVRWFTKALHHSGVIQRLTLESFDNSVAPTFVAITAELGDAKDNPAPVVEKFQWKKHPRVLIVGGGASHDFNRWFNEADSATLSVNTSVNYTEDISRIDSALKDIDALYLCNNQPMTDATLRKNIFAFADAGKPLLLTHPALWYNWNDWPEYNRVLVGGGARGHEKYGEFEVTVTESGHPIMQGVPKTFRISDELYQFADDPNGTPIQVLATGKSLVTGKVYPVVWITKHPKTKIVCITLGHDAAAHDLPAYKTILQNAVDWMTQGTQP